MRAALQLPLSNDKTSALARGKIKESFLKSGTAGEKRETGPVAPGRHPPISPSPLPGNEGIAALSSRRFLRGASPDKPGQS